MDVNSPETWRWIWLVAVVVFTLASLVPLGRRLEGRDEVHPVGANRWEGRTDTVVTEIPAGKHETGMVRLDRETWRAESTNGMGVAAGATVLVTHMTGTRVIVSP